MVYMKECKKIKSPFLVAGVSLLVTIVVGIITILVWKLIIAYLNKREKDKFEMDVNVLNRKDTEIKTGF